MKEKLEWCYDKIQLLNGVPVTEHNLSILTGIMMNLKEMYKELERQENDRPIAAEANE